MSRLLAILVLEKLVILPLEEKKQRKKEGLPCPVPKKVISQAEKLVLDSLASYARDDGTKCFPSRRKLARKALCSIRTAADAIRKFKDDGVLVLDEKDGRKITRQYRLDIVRALELYSAYPPPKGELTSYLIEEPGSHDGKPKGEVTSHDGNRKGEVTSSREEVTSRREEVTSPESCKESCKESSAPAGAPADESAPAGADKPPVCEKWNALKGEFREHFGEQVFKSWIAVLFPEADDGKTLVLACATALIKDYVTEHYLKDLQNIVGRIIKIECRSWAAGATTRVDREGASAA